MYLEVITESWLQVVDHIRSGVRSNSKTTFLVYNLNRLITLCVYDVCMYVVRIYVCICMYVCVCMYLCMHVCIYIYITHIHTFIYFKHMYEFVCVYDELMKVYRFVTHQNSTMYPPDKEHLFAVFTFVPM